MKVEIDVAGKTYAQAMREFEAGLIVAALNAHGCNKTRAAQALGLTLDTFRRKVRPLKVAVRAVLS
jgi:DNA-binding NtrC family response regulator